MVELQLHERLEDIADSLRPLPSTAVELATAVADDDASFDDLAAIVMQDPGMVLSLLTEANSASSSPANQISTVKDAIIRLGVARVLALTVTGCLAPTTNTVVPGYQVSTNELWDHARRSADVADIIRRMSPLDIEAHAVTAALLQDLGKTVLGEVLADSLLDDARAHHGGLVSAERELTLVDHGEVGALMLEIWNLPRTISDPVRYHHTPHEGGLSAHVIYVADAAVHQLMDTTPDIDSTDLHPSLDVIGVELDPLLTACTKKFQMMGIID